MNLGNRIALGTVQFGRPYGIANQSGQVNYDEIAAILDYAWSAKIDTLDTAMAYGESEQRLGEIGIAPWKVITKLPALPDICGDVAGFVKRSITDSLQKLKLSRLHGLLLHHPQQLLGSYGTLLYQTLARFKEEGIVNKIGISIYDPEELATLCQRYPFDLVQAPFNILDRRIVTSGWLNRLRQTNTEVHVRSIFLQGLLLMTKQTRPVIFNRWQPVWNNWERWMHENNLTPLKACLNFVLSKTEINRVLVGIDSLKQLQEIIAGIKAPFISPPKTLISDDLDLINPSRWNVL